MLNDTLLFVTGKDFNYQAVTPQDLALAVAYMKWKAVPGRTGDASVQALMMAAVTSAATMMAQQAAARGMPGF